MIRIVLSLWDLTSDGDVLRTNLYKQLYRYTVNTHMRYLVDHPVQPYFSHIAVCAWPVDPRHYQTDWVNAVNELEGWLVDYIGHHYSHWVYATLSDQQYWQACVGFSLEKHKSIFLLRWG